MTSNDFTLEDRAYKTAKVRFNASDRLKVKQKSLVYTITLITIVQISASVVLLTCPSHKFVNLLSTVTINFSVFIAIISNTDSLSKDILSAHHFHECGLKLMKLARELHKHSPEEQKNFQHEYDQIIDTCSENHSYFDYKLAEIQIHNSQKELRYVILHKLSALLVSIVYILFATISFFITFFLTN